MFSRRQAKLGCAEVPTQKQLQRTRLPYNPVAVGLFVGCTTFLLGALVDLVTGFFLAGTLISRFADDLTIAIAAGLLVFLYQRRRNRYLAERLRVIAEMNHHVRNALQTVSYSAHIAPDQNLRVTLGQASDRIQWALNEILPGTLRP